MASGFYISVNTKGTLKMHNMLYYNSNQKQSISAFDFLQIYLIKTQTRVFSSQLGKFYRKAIQ